VVALVIMVLAGTLEGASLGWFQWRMLRGWLPQLPARSFIGATVGVAAGGWLIGMSVPLVLTATRAMPPVVTASAVVQTGPGAVSIGLFAMGFGAIAGALFGAVQGRVLAAHVQGVRWWVLGSSAGWACGLPIAYLAGSLGTPAIAGWQIVGLTAIAGLGMGLCVGVATHAAIRHMTPHQAPRG
jgi:hypothetical protein